MSGLAQANMVNSSGAFSSFCSPASQIDLPDVDVRREGRVEPPEAAQLELSTLVQPHQIVTTSRVRTTDEERCL